MGQESVGQLLHAASPEALSTSLRDNIDSFEIVNVGQVANNVRLKEQLAVLNAYPYSPLLNPTGAALAKAGRISFQRVDSGFFKRHCGMHWHHQVYFLGRRSSQTTDDIFHSLLGPLLKQCLTANQSWALVFREIIEEGPHSVGFAHNHEGG